ncbi:uncharacterized protein LOC119589789 [Penaeus monodon]|uniref:uncharacterized protein LOC119589789 n=1 Tax=Penaeus monodon TaxID=6687 RepID=UPI0018A70676|nr:uncharacterized protein LOC119589789 [Penaeus monodon]
MMGPSKFHVATSRLRLGHAILVFTCGDLARIQGFTRFEEQVLDRNSDFHTLLLIVSYFQCYFNFDVLKAQAEALGLQGNDIAQYVISQQTLAREERAKERAFQKEQLEAEKEKVKLEHELQMARLNNPSASSFTSVLFDGASRPCLPVFKDGEDMTSYLIKFERIASLLNFREETYAIRLGNLRVYVKEHNVSSLSDAVSLSDNWASAHSAYPKSYQSFDQGKRSVAPKPPTPIQPALKRDFSSVKCHGCGDIGHTRSRCPKNPLAYKQYSSVPTHKVGFSLNNRGKSKFMTAGTLNGAWVSTILRDTGCTCVIVSDKLLPDVDVSSTDLVGIEDYLGRVDYFPKTKCFLKCPYFEGWVDVVRAPIKFCSILVGNVPGAYNPKLSPDFDLNVPQHSNNAPLDYSCAIQTRSSKVKRVHPLVLPEIEPLKVTPEEFAKLQAECHSLTKLWEKVKSEELDKMRDGTEFKYEQRNGLLYRTCVASKHYERLGKSSLVVPSECRAIILSVGHESPLAGHFSHRKSEMRIKDHFYWPNMGAEIRDFCKSCDKCQRMSTKGRVRPVPLKSMPILTEPFSRVSIDLVGPFSPPSSEGHRYILTLIDFATGFPEALPLKEIDSISVAEALLVIFSRVGIPREILSDRGRQFVSQLMGELHKLLGVKPLFTTPYHPSGNGRVERFHATLKASLRKLCSDKPCEWHRYLVPTLFAMREIPSDRTGFSAFELLYGRTVRGPLSVLRDLWEDTTIKEDDRSSFQYVIELKDKLEECAKIAARNAEISSTKFKSYFDLKSQDRKFRPGEEVLVLLPDNTNKLLMSWNGPYTVLECRNKVNYLIDEGGKPKLLHANLLKKYHRRAISCQPNVMDEESKIDVETNPKVVQNCILEDTELSDCNFPLTSNGEESILPENDQPDVCSDLSAEQKSDIQSLTTNFRDVFSLIPGCTNTLEHEIEVNTTERIKSKIYPIPIHLKAHFEAEVDQLLEQGIIQLSSSPHSSPVVMVKKSDGSYRMAIDYRAVNSVTNFHAEPACTMEEDLYKFSGCKYFFELDLTKAYYQIKLSEKARPLTAFPSHKELGKSTQRLFFSVLERLREHNLTAKPSKCRFVFKSIHYLGFILDDSSDVGLGAVLLQYVDGHPFPVAYASRKLLDRERRYSTIEKEGLAIIFAFRLPLKKIFQFLTACIKQGIRDTLTGHRTNKDQKHTKTPEEQERPRKRSSGAAEGHEAPEGPR